MAPFSALSGGPGPSPGPGSPSSKHGHGASGSGGGASGDSAPPRARRRVVSPPKPQSDPLHVHPRADPLRPSGFALTAVADAPPRANVGPLGVRLCDVVAGTPDVAFASNFCVDPRWLLGEFSALREATSALVLAVGDAGVAPVLESVLTRRDIVSAPVTAVVTPKVERYGTHHSKFFILLYPGVGTRVVVVTGNFLAVEYGAKTQGVWWQDFPLVGESPPPQSDFGDTLHRYIQALSLPTLAARALARVLSTTDFSSARVDLVAAIPGNHAATEAVHWGRGRLGALLASTSGHHPSLVAAPIVAQCSSMGKLDERWVGAMVEAASGGTSRGGPPLGLPSEGDGAQPFSIIWPTVNQVRDSAEGWGGGSSIPGRAEYLALPSVASRLHTWVASATARGRAMPHIKTLARASPCTGRLAWAVLGSANLSAAAWGGVPTQRGKHGPGSVYIKSFELSVLFTPQREATYRAHPHYGFCAHPLPPGSSLFDVPPPPEAAPSPPTIDFVAVGAPEGGPGDTVAEAGVERVRLPLPYDLPLTRYTKGDSPWASGVLYEGVDVFGTTWPEAMGMPPGLM